MFTMPQLFRLHLQVVKCVGYTIFKPFISISLHNDTITTDQSHYICSNLSSCVKQVCILCSLTLGNHFNQIYATIYCFRDKVNSQRDRRVNSNVTQMCSLIFLLSPLCVAYNEACCLRIIVFIFIYSTYILRVDSLMRGKATIASLPVTWFNFKPSMDK